MKYKELLKDGRWQVKRTKIMSRDNFTCRICGAMASDGATLNVHHLHYKRGAAPWEYNDSELVTICERCHKKEHDRIRKKSHDLRIGDIVVYRHSDYDNYGVIYDVDFVEMKAMMASVDCGADYSLLWLDELSIYSDGTLWQDRKRPVFKERDFMFDWDEGYFYACVASNIAKAKHNFEHCFFNDYIANGSIDIHKEVKRMVSNYDTILKNNPKMKEFINS